MADTLREKFETWARDHLGQGYPLTMDENVYDHPVTRWAFKAFVAGRASRPAEVDDEDLPLPESKFCAWLQHGRVWNAFPHGVGDKARWDRGGYWSAKGFDREPLFTAEQYRQGQRDAVAAYKRQQVALQQLADQAQELDMGYGAAPSHTTIKEK